MDKNVTKSKVKELVKAHKVVYKLFQQFPRGFPLKEYYFFGVLTSTHFMQED